MSSLKLTIDFSIPYDDEPWTFEYKTFDVLNDYLQPQSHTSPSTAALQLNELLEPIGLLQIWDIVFRVAGQIPHDHPSQDRLIALILALRDAPIQPNHFASLEHMDMTLTDILHQTTSDPPPATTGSSASSSSEEKDAASTTSSSSSFPYKNLHTLAARLTHAGLAARPADAIVAFSLALEHRPDPRSRAYQTRAAVLNFHVPIAADWIMVAGHEVYVQYIAAASDQGEAADYAAGPLWRRGGTWMERWAFWKEGFADVAEREKGCGEGVREVAMAAAGRMGEIERGKRGA